MLASFGLTAAYSAAVPVQIKALLVWFWSSTEYYRVAVVAVVAVVADTESVALFIGFDADEPG